MHVSLLFNLNRHLFLSDEVVKQYKHLHWTIANFQISCSCHQVTISCWCKMHWVQRKIRGMTEQPTDSRTDYRRISTTHTNTYPMKSTQLYVFTFSGTTDIFSLAYWKSECLMFGQVPHWSWKKTRECQLMRWYSPSLTFLYHNHEKTGNQRNAAHDVGSLDKHLK